MAIRRAFNWSCSWPDALHGPVLEGPDRTLLLLRFRQNFDIQPGLSPALAGAEPPNMGRCLKLHFLNGIWSRYMDGSSLPEVGERRLFSSRSVAITVMTWRSAAVVGRPVRVSVVIPRMVARCHHDQCIRTRRARLIAASRAVVWIPMSQARVITRLR